MELRFQVDPHLIESIRTRIGEPDARGADIALAALTMLDWGTRQAEAGRDIASMDASGNHVRGWECPVITQARGNRDA